MLFVSQNTFHNTEYNETYDIVGQKWATFLHTCGFLPIFLPNAPELIHSYIDMLKPRRFLLTGGSESFNRTQVESILLNYAIENNYPILGVCHGMQFIQRYFGTELEQVQGHVTPTQSIYIQSNEVIKNSYHDFGSYKSPDEFNSWAIAKDGVIKAIMHKSRPIAGMMWHPERSVQFEHDDLDFFKKFLGKTTYA